MVNSSWALIRKWQNLAHGQLHVQIFTYHSTMIAFTFQANPLSRLVGLSHFKENCANNNVNNYKYLSYTDTCNLVIQVESSQYRLILQQSTYQKLCCYCSQIYRSSIVCSDKFSVALSDWRNFEIWQSNAKLVSAHDRWSMNLRTITTLTNTGVIQKYKVLQ